MSDLPIGDGITDDTEAIRKLNIKGRIKILENYGKNARGWGVRAVARDQEIRQLYIQLEQD